MILYLSFLIICIGGFSSDSFKSQFERSDQEYFLSANCEFWAKHCYVLSKESIKDLIYETPMIDMVALGHFVTNQEQCMELSEDSIADPTILWLRGIAKEKLEDIKLS